MAEEISIGELVLGASAFVQGIVGVLVIMSVLCWAVIFQKMLAVRKTKKNIKFLQQMFDSDFTLQNMFTVDEVNKHLPMFRIFLTIVLRWSNLGKAGITGDKKNKELEKTLEQSVDKEMDILDNNLYILAIIGSTSPFVGLLGTVWGIMNSFVAIASNQQASLAIVAPGIAEALFVTALGLITAIPAMIAYNKFSHDVDILQLEMDTMGNYIIHSVLKDINNGDKSTA